MDSPARRLRIAMPLFLAAASFSCFEPPVRETMRISFRTETLVDVRIETRIARIDSSRGEVAARLEDVRREAERGEDSWTRTLKELKPAIEKYSYEYRGGTLAEVHRGAALTEPAALPGLFRSLPLGVYYKQDGDRFLLELVPTGGDLATARQAREVREQLDSFAEAVSAFAAKTAALYDYLGDRPDRARAVFEEIFEDLVPQEQRWGGTIEDEEKDLLDALQEAMKDLLSVLVVQEGEAYTLEEKSRLLFDPFPAELTVEVPGLIEEVEGFERRGERSVGTRPVGLWSALRALEGRWISPDVAVAYVDATLAGPESPFDVSEFAGRPRVAEADPSPAEVREALLPLLRAEDLYRVSWRYAGLDGGEEERGDEPGKTP